MKSNRSQDGFHSPESDHEVAAVTDRPKQSPQERFLHTCVSMLLVALIGLIACSVATMFLHKPPGGQAATVLTKPPVRLTLVPQGDRRAYLYSELPNGLQVLNVMDNRSEYKAVAMAVQAGSFDEPVSLPGLAHFCEHMLFLGTKRYPNPTGFDDFTTQRGGMSNAYTANDVTVYFAEYSEPNSSNGLARFADFFREPLFNKTFVQKEVHAIDSEHAKNVQDPRRRVLQTLYSLADPASPLSRFHTGDVHTLYLDPLKEGVDPVDSLGSYFRDHYCPGRMRLVTYGAQSPDEQRRDVDMYLGDLVSLSQTCTGKRTVFWADPNPWPKQRMQQWLEVQGTLPQTELWVHFSLPDLSAYYQSQPLSYIDHALSYGGENSLSNVLKDELGLVTSAQAMFDMASSGTNVFVIFTLTHKGRDQLGLVLSVFYAYLAEMRRHGIDEALYKSLEEIARLQWDWAESAGPADMVANLAERMTRLPASQLLSGDGLIAHPDPKLVEALLERLTPDNMNVIHVVPPSVAPANEGESKSDGQGTRTLPYYNVRYMVQNVSDVLPGFSQQWSAWLDGRVEAGMALRSELIQKFPDLAATNVTNLVLPERPKPILDVPIYLPTEYMHADSHDAGTALAWGPQPTSLTNTSTFLSNITSLTGNRPHGTPMPEVWYRRGWVSFSPKVSTQILLIPMRGPDEPEVSTMDEVRLAIYGRLLAEEMSPRLVDLTNTGVNFKIGVGGGGLSFTFNGFEPLMPRLVEKVLAEFSRFNRNHSITKPSRFGRVVDDIRESLNTYSAMPVEYAVADRSLLVTWGSHARKEMVEALEKIDIPSAASSVDQVLLSRPLQLTSLTMGNIAFEKAVKTIQAVSDHFNGSTALPVPGSVVQRTPYIVNPPSPVEARLRNPRDGDPNDAVVVSLIAGEATVAKRVHMELLGKILGNVINKELRTQRQLGYVVSGGVGLLGNVLYLSSIVQGTVLNADELEAAVESVYQNVMPMSLNALTQDEFLSYKASTMRAFLQPPTSTAEEAAHFWGPVVQGGHCFDLQSNLIRFLNESVPTKDALIKEYTELVMPTERMRKKVVVKYFAHKVPTRWDLNAAEAAYTKQGVPPDAIALLSREHKRTMVFDRVDADTRLQIMGVEHASYFSQDLNCKLETNLSALAPAALGAQSTSSSVSASRAFLQHLAKRGLGSSFHVASVLSAD